MDRISPERLDIIQMGWVRLMARVGVDPGPSYPLFDQLIAAYGEPHRAYHDLLHITEMHKIAGKLADSAQDHAAIALGIWYHDAIYDPRANDNEAQSANLARTALGSVGVAAATIDKVCQLILATAHANLLEPIDLDTAVMLDADLAILGADPKRYAQYAQGVRQEYAWVDEAIYRQKRGDILRGFLGREFIYRTPRMRSVGEMPARENLVAELTLLGEPVV